MPVNKAKLSKSLLSMIRMAVPCDNVSHSFFLMYSLPLATPMYYNRCSDSKPRFCELRQRSGCSQAGQVWHLPACQTGHLASGGCFEQVDISVSKKN